MTTATLFRNIRRRAAGLLATTALVCAPFVASAHDFWLQPTQFQLAPGATTTMSIQVGHGVNRQKSLITADRVTRFDSFSAGSHLDRRPELKLGDSNTDTTLHFPHAGVQLLVFETNGTYSDLPDIRFNDYITFEGMTPALDLRRKTNTSTADGKEVYSRRAKALIQVGPYNRSDDAIATKPVGMSLEIVPLANPYAPGFKGNLPVRIYYYGQPLAGATVMMNNLQFDDRPTQIVKSDSQGDATMTIPRIGEWQVNVVWTKPISGDPQADYETMFSSLTFGYAPGSH